MFTGLNPMIKNNFEELADSHVAPLGQRSLRVEESYKHVGPLGQGRFRLVVQAIIVQPLLKPNS